MDAACHGVVSLELAQLRREVHNMTADTSTIDPQPGKGRARITNGSELLPTVDGRSTWARLFRDIVEAMAAHCGGSDRLSEPERMTARRVAAMEAELVYLEAGFAQSRADGKAPTASDLDLYSRISNTQRRHLEALGMQRRPRDLVPDLQQYVGKAA